ncbi:Hypothetical_protein [Hexamita inflata]|uniref:Hypothetical_protein n=1 Tax=Hexamita inflata TaxID=28002 RepID=A0AA86NHR1_9EUKA|nr:Hypothetical protein HINF_LOCUS6953 [Hexamita inflata]
MYFCKLQSSLNSLQLKHKQSSTLLNSIKIMPSLSFAGETDSTRESVSQSATFHNQLVPDFTFKYLKDKLDELDMSMEEDVELFSDEEEIGTAPFQVKIGALCSLFQ